MPQPPEPQGVFAWPLAADWEGVRGLQTATYVGAAAAWRAGLSSIFGSRISGLPRGSDEYGVISTAQRGPIGLHRLCLPPQAFKSTPALDAASNLVVLILLSGKATYTSHANRRVLGPGDVLPLPFWDEFGLEAECDVVAAVLQVPIWWTLDKATGPDKMRWMGAENLIVSADFFLHPVLLSAAYALLRSGGLPDHAAQAEHVFGAALIHTLNAAAPRSDYLALPRTRFSRIYNHVMLNVGDEGLSPKDTAEVLRISVRTLHQACADKGTTFNSVVADMRLRYAAYLLRTSGTRISEVAFATGYKSLPHFCRQFKEKFGISARRYRMDNPDHSGATPSAAAELAGLASAPNLAAAAERDP